jgi:hypothetical protein
MYERLHRILEMLDELFAMSAGGGIADRKTLKAFC